MTFYTYPRAIDEFERRLLDAVNSYYAQPEGKNIYTTMFALHVDTNVDGNNPRMRPGFVWEIMGSGIIDQDGCDALLSKCFAYWWRQRWHQRVHAPEYTGMYEQTKRGLVVQLAQLCEAHSDSEQALPKLIETISVLTASTQLRWEYLISLAEIVPTYSVLSQAYAPIAAPFPISDSTWHFIWSVLSAIHPNHVKAMVKIAMLVDSPTEFGRALDDFFGAATAQAGHLLPESLVS